MVALTYAGHLGRFSFSDRNRGERVTGVPGGDWRYRNRLSVSHPLLIGPVRSVTASDEVFYDGARDRWSRNRAQLGVGLAPLGRLSMQIYILRQDDRFSKPGHLNVLGLALGLKLGRRH